MYVFEFILRLFLDMNKVLIVKVEVFREFEFKVVVFVVIFGIVLDVNMFL